MYSNFRYYPYFQNMNSNQFFQNQQFNQVDQKPPKGWVEVPYEPHTYCGSYGGAMKHLVLYQGGYIMKPHSPHYMKRWGYN